jgi:hypothetical protein
VDINDSLDCTNEDDIILFLAIPRVICIVSDLESELDTSKGGGIFFKTNFRLLPFSSNCTNHSNTKSTWYQEPI